MAAKPASPAPSPYIEQAPIPMAAVAGPSHVLINANNAFCRLADKAEAELVGKPFGEIWGERAESIALLDRVYQSGKSESYMAPHRAGTRPAFRFYTMWPVADDEPTIGIMIQATETTPLYEQTLAMNEALVVGSLRQHELTAAATKGSEAKSRFLAAITHDLRTPLHGILGYVELLFLDGGLSPTQSRRLEAMTAAGQYLLGTIDAVLDMSQIEADRVELQPVGIELNDLIRTCFDVVRPRAQAKGLVLVLAPAAAPLRLYADSTRLQQVVINLLGNAVKFTPAGSVEVRLQPSADGERIRLEVTDTGPGIGEKQRDKLFQAFERLNAQAVSGIEGSGLGLAIASRLVHLMDGQIGYADNPGGGSVFWVELPRGAVPSTEAEAAVSSPLAGLPRLRVLVADDEAMNRSIASGFLHHAGHEVVCVDDGAAAVKAAAAEDFDVILMDVRMPVMDGLEATRRIRALPAPRGEVRVVAMTAHAFAEQIERCRQVGMDGHVSKPFKQAVLLAALKNVMVARNDTKPAALPVAAAQAEAGPHLPVLDGGAFEDIAESLSAAELGENLQILITRCEALLGGLRRPRMLSQTSELAEIAHKLAGGGGAMGFLYVAAAARQFERAVESGAADAPVFANRLSAAIEASMPAMRECMGRTVAA